MLRSPLLSMLAEVRYPPQLAVWLTQPSEHFRVAVTQPFHKSLNNSPASPGWGLHSSVSQVDSGERQL